MTTFDNHVNKKRKVELRFYILSRKNSRKQCILYPKITKNMYLYFVSPSKNTSWKYSLLSLRFLTIIVHTTHLSQTKSRDILSLRMQLNDRRINDNAKALQTSLNADWGENLQENRIIALYKQNRFQTECNLLLN